MSTIRKYAGLPDLDPSPDIYETPELTDDTSTQQTSNTLGSNTPEDVQDEDGARNIDRQRLDPYEARTHFLPSDGTHLDKTSRIDTKRKLYRSTSRKRRQHELGSNGIINGLELSSEDEEESLDRKLARLHKEIAEVKEECERNGEKNKSGSPRALQGMTESVEKLSLVLDGIGPPSRTNDDSSARRLAQGLASVPRLKEPSHGDGENKTKPHNEEGPSYTVSYAPRYQEHHAMSKVSAFDTRLALLESTLGIDSIPLPTQRSSSAKPVIPSLDAMDKQLTTLSTSTETSLDSVSRRVRQLTQDTEKLEQARKSARAAQEALRQEALSPTSDSSRSEAPREMPKFPEMEDPGLISKINALYGTLPTIESLAPMLPSVLDRLRSLRSLHADAAGAGQTLAKVESRQEEMREELRGWREGLEKVERAMEQGEEVMKGNTETVEGWVKELERRMEGLGH